MNYKRIYNDLINLRKAQPASGYTEIHHIIMRSMGGTDDSSNLVRLTGREHWIAHLLLYKIHKNSQTVHACHMMAMRCEERGIPYVKNSRMYERVRKEFAKRIGLRNQQAVGEKNSQYGTRWICNIELQENKKILNTDQIPDGWVIGRNKWTEAYKARQNRTKKYSPEHRAKMSEITKGRVVSKGWKHSEEAKQKMSASKRGNKSHADMVWVTDGIINKTIPKNSNVPEGFRYGMKSRKFSKRRHVP
jgi:hypothetical protein